MLKTIIIDDEMISRKIIRNIVNRECSGISIIDEAIDVKSGIASIEKNKPDLVLLDIEMPDGTGFDLLEKTESTSFKTIFITASEDYEEKACKCNAVDYILKPFCISRLVNAIEKAKAK